MNEVTIMEMVRPYLHNGRVNGYELEEKVLSHFSRRQGYDIVNILADHNIDIDYEEDDAVNNRCDDSATVMSSSLAGPILFGDKGNIDITSDEFKAQVENSKMDYDFHDNPELFEKYLSEKQTLEEKDKIRQTILLANRKLVKKIANDYFHRHRTGSLTLEDLIEEGFIGLDKAIRRFDPSLGNEFSTYATYWIEQSIDRQTKNEGFIVRIPVHVQERIIKLRKLEAKKIPDAEIIKAMSLTDFETLNRLRGMALAFRNVVSISLSVDNNEDGGTTLEKILSYDNDFMSDEGEQTPEDIVLEKDRNEEIERIFHEKLKPREVKVLKMRFGFDGQEQMTLEKIGQILGVSRERIRQIQNKAMRKLRTYKWE